MPTTRGKTRSKEQLIEESLPEAHAHQSDPFDFSDIKTPDEVKRESGEALSLEELLSGMSPLGETWPGHYYQSPKVRHLKRLFNALNAVDTLPAGDNFAALDALAAVVCSVVRVVDGGALRRVTLEEVQDQFDQEELPALLPRLFRKDGFVSDEANRGNG
jgi:hypothetical protein